MMKRINIYVLAFLITGFAVSCKKKLEEMNVNPNQPTDVTVETILPSAQANIAYTIGGDISRITSVWTQQMTGASRQWVVLNSYTTTDADFDNAWRFGFYGGAMMDLHLLNQKAEAQEYWQYAGISKVLMAYTLGVATDLWGDVPFSEAFEGEDANITPAYDSQQSIYAAMQTLLDDAITNLSDPSATQKFPGNDDMIYGGDASLWIKFAHSLKARNYLHLAKVDAANYTKALTEVAMGFSSVDDDANFYFADVATFSNPAYQFDEQRGDIEVSGYMIDTMTAMNDPRLSVFENGGYMGSFYGSTNSPVPMMNYSELRFIEAECAFQTSDLTTAAAALDTAVMESLTRYGVTGDSAFMADYASEVDTTVSMGKIMLQKYINGFYNPETWTDWRRTGLPSLAPVAGTSIPTRLFYAQSENRYNPNVPTTGVTQFDKVWWDQ